MLILLGGLNVVSVGSHKGSGKLGVYHKTAAIVRGGFQMKSFRLSGSSGGEGCAATIGSNAFPNCGMSL